MRFLLLSDREAVPTQAFFVEVIIVCFFCRMRLKKHTMPK